MPGLSRLIQPLRSAAAAFFKHDVALRRADGGSVHVVLQQREAAPRGDKARRPTAAARAEASARKESAELLLVRDQLATLLDDMPETRQTMRHLVFVEQALAKKGLRALHKLPLDVLRRALEQLEGLVTNWSPEGLANLRSKMAVAIIDREHMSPAEAEADAYRTAAVLDPNPEPALLVQEVAQDDEQALAAAYAAMGAWTTADTGYGDLNTLVPGQETGTDALEATGDGTRTGAAPAAEVEMHTELGSPSARAIARQTARPAAREGTTAPASIELRELQT